MGQAPCLILLVISKGNFYMRMMGVWIWLYATCLLVYYGLWARYLLKDREYSLLWKPPLFIPAPMAVFPVAAYSFAAL
jgi:hypothetical protein